MDETITIYTGFFSKIADLSKFQSPHVFVMDNFPRKITKSKYCVTYALHNFYDNMSRISKDISYGALERGQDFVTDGRMDGQTDWRTYCSI